MPLLHGILDAYIYEATVSRPLCYMCTSMLGHTSCKVLTGVNRVLLHPFCTPTGPDEHLPHPGGGMHEAVHLLWGIATAVRLM